MNLLELIQSDGHIFKRVATTHGGEYSRGLSLIAAEEIASGFGRTRTAGNIGAGVSRCLMDSLSFQGDLPTHQYMRRECFLPALS